MHETTTALSYERGSDRPRKPRLRRILRAIGLILIFIIILLAILITLSLVITIEPFYDRLFDDIIVSIFPLFIIAVSILAVREQHADEIYFLWFIFFSLTYILFGVYYYFSANVIDWQHFQPYGGRIVGSV